MDIKATVYRILKGFIVGSSMLVPGVSGGTMAIMLNAYDEMIHSAASLLKAFKSNLFILLSYGLGAVIGIYLFSDLVLKVLESYPGPMLCFFSGAILGSLPTLYRKAAALPLQECNRTTPENKSEGNHHQEHNRQQTSYQDNSAMHFSHNKKSNSWYIISAIWCFLGIGIGLGLLLLPKNLFSPEGSSPIGQILLLLVAGVIIAIALILPGISASYVLLILGLYEKTLQSMGNFDIPFLFPLVLGVLLGTVLTVKALEEAMSKKPQVAYFLIMGFMLGSLPQIAPGFPPSIGQAVLWACTFALGLILLFAIGKRL